MPLVATTSIMSANKRPDPRRDYGQQTGNFFASKQTDEKADD
jgi:hypothetical protein